jgi:hypothetical protein
MLDNKEHTSACLCVGVYSRQNEEQYPPPRAIKALLYRQAMQLAGYFPLRPFLFMFAHSWTFDDKPEQPAIVHVAFCGVSCQFVSYLIVQPFRTKHCKHVHAVVCVQQSGLGRCCSPIF